MSLDVGVFAFAHHMALLPLAWLLALRICGERRSAAWWWIAGAFGVSWLADTAAHWISPWIIGAVYPITQAVMIASVLLPRWEAVVFALVVIAVGIAETLIQGRTELTSPNVLLRTVAWGGVALIARGHGRLTLALLTAFGLGWAAWMAYAITPGWPSWGVYQIVRATSLVLFCWASFGRRHEAPAQ